MRTILLPVDTSETSDNAVKFAAEWSKKYGYQRIILLKTFYDTLFDDVAISAEYGTTNFEYRSQEREDGTQQMIESSRQLSLQLGNEIEVVAMTSELPLLRAVMGVIEQEDPELIIVGSDNKDYDNDSYVAGNVIQIAKASPVRVLVVPAGYQYRPVKQVLVPCDVFVANSLHKLNHLHPTPFWNEVEFEILNIDPKELHLHPDEKFKQAEEKLHEYLKGFQHHLHYTNERNVIEGIIQFVKNNPVQLIIALPGRYSFLYALTHKTISEAICTNTQEPVMILK